jgi:hypothetical protein
MRDSTIKRVKLFSDLPIASREPKAIYMVEEYNGTLFYSDGSIWIRQKSESSPIVFTSQILDSVQDGAVFICQTAQTATLNVGLNKGFGVAFKGTVNFVAGSGVIVNDLRVTGSSSPWCAVVQIATDQYDVLGSKA